MITGNEPAMPYAVGGKTLNGADDYIADGLSIREYFAALAMQGYLSGYPNYEPEPEEVAKRAVSIANALIAELNKPAKP